MTQKESLKILDNVCGFVDSMSDEELFNYMMENSASFKAEVSKKEAEMNTNTSSSFKFDDSSSISVPDLIALHIYDTSVYTEKTFKQTEEIEAYEWQIMTEAA